MEPSDTTVYNPAVPQEMQHKGQRDGWMDGTNTFPLIDCARLVSRRGHCKVPEYKWFNVSLEESKENILHNKNPAEQFNF